MSKYILLAIFFLTLLVAAIRTFMESPAPLSFSELVSYLVMAIIAGALLWVLVLTIRGHMVDRRVVFVFVGVALVMPYFMKIPLKIKVSPEVQKLYDGLAKLPKGSKVLASFDYDPPSAPELQPMADAFMAYAFKNDLKVIIIGLWPQGPQQANIAITRAMVQPEIKSKNLRYGQDYVNLGFQSGNEFVIQSMGTSFRTMFRRDVYGTPYDSIPLLRGVENYSNVDYVMNLSAGYPGTKEWVQYGVDRFAVKVGAGNTAVQAPEMYPYLSAGQLVGLAGGMTGAAEFEKTVNERGRAYTSMLSQIFSHVVVIAFIIIGNVALFIGRKKSS